MKNIVPHLWSQVKDVKFHHHVKRFYYKNLFRKIYTIAILGLVAVNIFSLFKYQSFADESTASVSAVTVIYNANGGYFSNNELEKTVIYTKDNETNKYVASENIQFPNKATNGETGFMFAGWYIESGESSWQINEWYTQDDELEAIGLGNTRTVYAKWLPFKDLPIVIGGKTVATIMDRNLGAEEVADENSYDYKKLGFYYQWGNNYGFKGDKNPPKVDYINNNDDYRVAADDYGPNNYYSSSTRKVNTKEPGWWTKNNNQNLWGGENSRNPDEYKQGPCPKGYHIPDIGEWSVITNIFSNYMENDEYCDGFSSNAKCFASKLLLPFAGYIDGRRVSYSNPLQIQWQMRYWSSSPLGNDAGSLFTRSDQYQFAYPSLRVDGVPIRCFKNSSYQKLVFDAENNIDTPLEMEFRWREPVTETYKPENPKKQGFIFDGWYIGDDEFIFSDSTLIGEDTVVKAKWIELFSVTFNSNGGSEIESQDIPEGYTATRPVDPTTGGAAIFKGRYIDEESENEFDFDTEINSNITLYAKREICPEGYIVGKTSCIPIPTDDGNGYIELTYGDETVYIKDRNQGASISAQKIIEIQNLKNEYNMCSSDVEVKGIVGGTKGTNNRKSGSQGGDFFGEVSDIIGVEVTTCEEIDEYIDEVTPLSYGDYYYRGNNIGASRDELGVDTSNPRSMRAYVSQQAIDRGFDGGHLGEPEGNGWIEGNIQDNPCDPEEGEYLPTPEDWKKAMEIWSETKGYDVNDEEYGNGRQFYPYDNNGNWKIDEFLDDIFVPNAGSVNYSLEALEYNNKNNGGKENFKDMLALLFASPVIAEYQGPWSYVSYNQNLYLWSALSIDNKIGEFWNGTYYYNNINPNEYDYDINAKAAPVRCFINPDYLVEGERYTVTFMDGDRVLFTKNVKEGKLLKNVQDPVSTEEGYGFAGWYTDPELKNEFNMTKAITKNITLYAKWVEKGIFHKNGYIKVTNGKDTIYVSDKNVGATVSQGLSIREDIKIKGNELFEKDGDTEEFEQAILNYAREKGIDFYFVDDLIQYLDSPNPLYWEINEYYGQKMLGLFYAYIEEEDLTEDEQQDLLKGMNKLYKSEFSTLDECYEHFVSLGMDVDGDAFELYVINSVTNKDFTDLSDAYDYINNYNQYNPEYGEVDVNSFGNYYFRGNNNWIKYENLVMDEDGNVDTGSLSSNFLAGSDFDNGGWKKGNNGNPCSGENEYLPSADDWKELMEIWGELNGYDTYERNNCEDCDYPEYAYFFDSDSLTPHSQFMDDMLIPSAGVINKWYNGNDDTQEKEEYMSYFNDESHLQWSSLDNGYLGRGFDPIYRYLPIELLELDQDDGYDSAYPIRCFLNITEPEDEEDTPTIPVTPEPTPSTPTNGYSGGGGGGKVTKPDTNKNDHGSAETPKSEVTAPLEGGEKNESSDGTKGSTFSKPVGAGSNKVVLDMESYNPSYSFEQNQAYQFAKSYGITTKPAIQDANLNGNLTRIQMAKMLSQYAVNILGKEPDLSDGTVKFADVSQSLDKKYDNGVSVAYLLGIMGQNMKDNRFRPYDEVTRGEFVTAFSRMIYNTSDGKYKSTPEYYTNHINKLSLEQIITKIDPKMKELRGYVMLMLYRSVK